MVIRSLPKGKRSTFVFSFFLLCWVVESALYYFTPQPSLRWFPSLSGRKPPCWSVTLTSTDGGEVPHVLEELVDDGAGPGVQAVAVDPQVELDPAGVLVELYWWFRGREVQLLFVHPSSSKSVRSVSSVGGRERKDLQEPASGRSICSFVPSSTP